MLPALRNLDFCHVFSTRDAYRSQKDISSLFDRSSCNLQRICLRQVTLTGHELTILLQGLPALVELVIEERRRKDRVQEDALVMVTAQVLKRMAHDVSKSSPVESLLRGPKLKRFHIIARFGFDDHWT